MLSLLIVLLWIAAIISQNDRAERFWNELDLVVRGTPYGTPYGRRASPGPLSGWSPCPLICFLSPPWHLVEPLVGLEGMRTDEIDFPPLASPRQTGRRPDPGGWLHPHRFDQRHMNLYFVGRLEHQSWN